MSIQNNVHFKKVGEEQKKNKFFLAAKSKVFITLWEKGNDLREEFRCVDFFSARLQVLIRKKNLSKLINKKILYSFKLNGLSFFGKGYLKVLDGQKYILEVNDEVFKGERRHSYRLLTYPHHEVIAHLPVPVDKNITPSNIVNINTKMSQTNLFRNFLTLINSDDDDLIEGKGHSGFRVLDISVSGLSFQSGKLESQFFQQNRVLKDLVINFKGERIEIPEARVVYNITSINTVPEQLSQKVGLEFLKLNTNLDQRLGHLINGTLRNIESDFEDFV